MSKLGAYMYTSFPCCNDSCFILAHMLQIELIRENPGCEAHMESQ